MNADSQLGGGCELALMCDIILASPTAKFGQPEINLGVIPGGGGSQRLIHAIGKSRTMELVLTGRMISAQEASDWGMVSRVVGEGEGEVVKEAINVANTIASKSQLAVQAGKEVVNAGTCDLFFIVILSFVDIFVAAYEMTLAEGLRFERRIFHGLFATNDQKEGKRCSHQELLLSQLLILLSRYGRICGEEESELYPHVTAHDSLHYQNVIHKRKRNGSRLL